MNTTEGRKRKLKTAKEMGDNLAIYFGKRGDQTTHTDNTAVIQGGLIQEIVRRTAVDG